MSTNYWMLVSTIDNFRKSKEMGFAVQGVKSRHRSKAEKMRPGDRILYYVTGVQAFAGTATITSTYWEERTPVWVSEKQGEVYPWRFKIRPDVVLDEREFLSAVEWAPKLAYVRKWPQEHWRLAFQGNVHLIPGEDFARLEAAMRQAAKQPALQKGEDSRA
ncbi:MAG: EVE domain-containing protein [Chloroflexi bacterium]|nr:EVE domain-containing protein [Chloroflexota bacterium]